MEPEGEFVRNLTKAEINQIDKGATILGEHIIKSFREDMTEFYRKQETEVPPQEYPVIGSVGALRTLVAAVGDIKDVLARLNIKIEIKGIDSEVADGPSS